MATVPVLKTKRHKASVKLKQPVTQIEFWHW